jgi:hypothetical protein
MGLTVRIGKVEENIFFASLILTEIVTNRWPFSESMAESIRGCRCVPPEENQVIKDEPSAHHQ